MSCTGPNCNGSCRWNFIMPCLVCEINNNDAALKKTCPCSVCGGYICKEHWNDPVARTIAATRKAVDKIATEVKKVFGKGKGKKKEEPNDTPTATA